MGLSGLVGFGSFFFFFHWFLCWVWLDFWWFGWVWLSKIGSGFVRVGLVELGLVLVAFGGLLGWVGFDFVELCWFKWFG